MRLTLKSWGAMLLLVLLPIAGSVAFHAAFPQCFLFSSWLFAILGGFLICGLLCVFMYVRVRRGFSDDANANKFVQRVALVIALVAAASLPLNTINHRRAEERHRVANRLLKELDMLDARAKEAKGPHPLLVVCDTYEAMYADYRKLADVYADPASIDLLVAADLYETFTAHLRAAAEAAYRADGSPDSPPRTKEDIETKLDNCVEARREIENLVRFSANVRAARQEFYADHGHAELSSGTGNMQLVESFEKYGEQWTGTLRSWSAVQPFLEFLVQSKDRWRFDEEGHIQSSSFQFREQLHSHLMQMEIMMTEMKLGLLPTGGP